MSSQLAIGHYITACSQKSKPPRLDPVGILSLLPDRVGLVILSVAKNLAFWDVLSIRPRIGVTGDAFHFLQNLHEIHRVIQLQNHQPRTTVPAVQHNRNLIVRRILLGLRNRFPQLQPLATLNLKMQPQALHGNVR